MPSVLSALINLSVTGKQVNALDLGSAVNPFAKSLAIALANGIGVNQADRVFADSRTLALSATEDLDLSGALLDAFGQAITMAKLKAVILVAAAGNTNDVNVTRPASNGVPLFLAAADGLSVKPGGAFVWVAPGAGVTVTPATGDLLTIANSGAGTPVTYDVILIGTSA
jgi:hypothetical protein